MPGMNGPTCLSFMLQRLRLHYADGAESWASNPAEDGRAAHFSNATVALEDGAGHWVHHDRPDAFMGLIRPFLNGNQA